MSNSYAIHSLSGELSRLAPKGVTAVDLLWLAMFIFGFGCSAESRVGSITEINNRNNVGGSESSGQAIEPAGGSSAIVIPTVYDSGQKLLVIDAGNDAACMATGSEAVPIEVEKEFEVPVEVPQPVALYIMLDQSGSMFDSVTGIPFVPPYKWNVAYDAITTFVRDPKSTELDVSIQYFPKSEVTFADPDAGVPSEDLPECQGTEYTTPDVPMGRLPEHAQAIIDSVTFHFPGGGGTPIEPALRGAIDFCKQYMSRNNNEEKCVVVLITDGLPTACNTDFTALAEIAGDGYSEEPSVKTFAIGMFGADFDLLNELGQQGGTDCTPNDPQTNACDVTAGMTLIEAFELIREYVIETRIEIQIEIQYVKMECQWEIPPPPEDEEFDREMVNVEFSSTGLETDKELFTKVDSKDECGNFRAWYYDDPQDPKEIIACPAACSEIEGADFGKIRILLGCKSVVIQ